MKGIILTAQLLLFSISFLKAQTYRSVTLDGRSAIKGPNRVNPNNKIPFQGAVFNNTNHVIYDCYKIPAGGMKI